MGSFRGHALPGSFYIVTSLWWLANVYRIHKLVPENSWVLVGNGDEFVEKHLNNYAHAAMYAVFMIWSVVETLQFYKITQLPTCSEHVFGSIALFVEGMLFFFHLEGRPKLDQLLHSILYIIVFMSALVMLLEAWMKNSFLLQVIRSSLFLLQGNWFLQIAHSLHGSRPWKNTKTNREFVSIVFAWHIIGVLLLIMLGFVAISIKSRGCHCRPTRNSPSLEEIEVHRICDVDFAERRSLMDEQE
ncbi:Transmembrane protein 45B [Exaiptasia diaphana]|nr:Transmembrane protein 45B [Exaiptasia diaphana]